MEKATEIFEKHWVKATGKPLDETTKQHMKYAIEAINEAFSTQPKGEESIFPFKFPSGFKINVYPNPAIADKGVAKLFIHPDDYKPINHPDK